MGQWAFLKPKLNGLDISKPEISLLDLHLFRVIYCLLLIRAEWIRWGLHTGSMENKPSWNPIPLFEFLGITRIPVDQFSLFYLALIICLGLAAIGWRPRLWLFLSCGLFFLVHGQLLGLLKNPDSNYVSHSRNIVVFILLILSMDSQIGKKSSILNLFRKSKELLETKVSSHSLHLVMVCYGIVYFGTSYLRFMNNGLSWMDGFTLKSFLLMSYFSEGSENALMLAQHHYVCQFLSILTIAFEISFLGILIFFRPYIVLLVAGLLFHNSIYWIMKISFLSYFIYGYCAFLFFKPINLGFLWHKAISKLNGTAR